MARRSHCLRAGREKILCTIYLCVRTEEGLPSGPEVEGFRVSWVDVEGNFITELTVGLTVEN